MTTQIKQADESKAKRQRSGFTSPFDFPVQKQEIMTVQGGAMLPQMAVVRTDLPKSDRQRYLGIVSPEHNLLTNVDLMNGVESSFNDLGLRFRLTDAGSNQSGKHFYGRWVFPDIKVNLGQIKTDYGVANDNIQMMLEVSHSYGQHIKGRFDAGGYRLICLNGQRIGNAMSAIEFLHRNLDEKELFTAASLQMKSLADMFDGELSDSWRELNERPYSSETTRRVMDALQYTGNIGQMYRKRMDDHLAARVATGKIRSQWDSYNSMTFVTSHYMDKRNLSGSIQTAQNAFDWILNPESIPERPIEEAQIVEAQVLAQAAEENVNEN